MSILPCSMKLQGKNWFLHEETKNNSEGVAEDIIVLFFIFPKMDIHVDGWMQAGAYSLELSSPFFFLTSFHQNLSSM